MGINGITSKLQEDWKIAEFQETDNFWKYIFEGKDLIFVTSLYKNDSRVLISLSTASGCTGGCTYCPYSGHFRKHLEYKDLLDQIDIILKKHDIRIQPNITKKFQIVFGEMGDPLFSWSPVEACIRATHEKYPSAEFYISTIAPNRTRPYTRLIQLGHDISSVNIVYSANSAIEEKRNRLVRTNSKLLLRQIRDMGNLWNKATGRYAYLSYLVLDGENNTKEDIEYFRMLFSPITFQCIFISPDEQKNEITAKFAKHFDKDGYTQYLIYPKEFKNIAMENTCNEWIAKHMEVKVKND